MAESAGRVLLTLDGDFWDDRKHPVRAVRRGIVIIAEPPDAHDRILRAFGLVYGCFAKTFPIGWPHMKDRSVIGEFDLKLRTWEGKVARYRMQLRGGRLVVKEMVDRRGRQWAIRLAIR
jgi:hypothetical protein